MVVKCDRDTEQIATIDRARMGLGGC